MDELAEHLDEILPWGWHHNADTYGLSFNLVCPHGHPIEQDGECPDGCVSPLVEAGIL